MRFIAERCEICQRRDAAVFMVVRQDLAPEELRAAAQEPAAGRQRVAKAYVCFTCFELVQEKPAVVVEAVSLQEFRETREAWRDVTPGG